MPVNSFPQQTNRGAATLIQLENNQTQIQLETHQLPRPVSQPSQQLDVAVILVENVLTPQPRAQVILEKMRPLNRRYPLPVTSIAKG